jgi:hypothetical protein
MSEIRIVENPMINWLKTFVGEIPFDVLNFPESSPYGNFPLEKVGGLEVPKLNDLTAKEAVIFEKLEASSANRMRDIRLKTRTLGNKAKAYLNLGKGQNGMQYIFPDAEFQQSDEYKAVAESDEFEEFFTQHEQEIIDLVELYKLLSDDKILSWVKAVFFLASRLGRYWLDNADLLLRSQIEQINEFIAIEANRGEPLEPVAAGDEEAEPAGKSSSETGRRTTGK